MTEIEAWGRGIQRMIDVCNEAGVPIPKVSYEPDDLRIEFQFSDSYVNAMSESASLVGEKMLPKTPLKTLPKTPDLILEQIRNDPHTTLAGISEIIGASLSATKRASSRLVKEGQIRYVGPAKGGHWEILEGSNHSENPVVEKTPPKAPPKTPPKTQGLILEQIRNDPHTTLAGISEIIGVSLSATKRASSRLVKEGKIKYVGPAKGGHWEMLEEGE